MADGSFRAMRWLVLAGVVGVAGLGGVAAYAMLRVPDGHRPLHIGCTHHNHGPKWHDGHGAALGLTQGGSRPRSVPVATDDLASRSFTAGRAARERRAED